MTSSDPDPGDAVKAVRFSEESLIVDLALVHVVAAPVQLLAQ